MLVFFRVILAVSKRHYIRWFVATRKTWEKHRHSCQYAPKSEQKRRVLPRYLRADKTPVFTVFSRHTQNRGKTLTFRSKFEEKSLEVPRLPVFSEW